MRVHSCLERPWAITEAEAAPFQVPESTRTPRGLGQAVRPRTKTTTKRCKTAKRGVKTIKMHVHSCLELPLAIPEAEAATFQVPESTRTHRGASTPEDMISASGIAPTRSRQLWMRIFKVFTPRLAVLRLLVVVALHVWQAAASATLSTSALLQALCAAVCLREDTSLMEGSRDIGNVS